MSIFYLGSNLILWGMLTILDFVAETQERGYYTIDHIFGLLAAPILMIIAYIIYRIVNDHGDVPFIWRLTDKAILLGMEILITVPVFALVEADLWIVKQARGWGDWMNGLEYVILGMMLGVVCNAFFLIFDLGTVLFLKIKSQKKVDGESNR